MGLADHSTAAGVSVTNIISASANDMIYVFTREIDGSPATPSGTGLPSFSAMTIGGGTPDSGAVRFAGWYTKCGITFNATLAFANPAHVYFVWVESGLVVTGTNGVDSIVQAVGHFDNAQDNPATISLSATDAGNRCFASWCGFQNLGDITPTNEGSGWTKILDEYNANTQYGVAHTKASGSTSQASIGFPGLTTQQTYGIALELNVSAGGGGGKPAYYYAQQ